MKILERIIRESERKGTGGVQPHNAILQGETLERIIIRNQVRDNADSFVVRVQTSATVWEFISEVSKMVGLAPIYTSFKMPNGRKIKDSEHGKVLSQLGFKNG